MLTKEQLDIITEKQISMLERFRSVSDEGKRIKYLDKEFIVHKNVFWPFEDSKPLIENYLIVPNESVLDVCTGSGVIAIFSAYKGASKVTALDISEDAVKTAKENVKIHGFDDKVDARVSNMFEALTDDEKFDVITGNLPFRNKGASNQGEVTMWDTNLNTHKDFFKGVKKHLNPGGRIYLSQANFGAVDEMKVIAEEEGFVVRLIGQNKMPEDSREFYAFELKRK
jgi:release factor glutamine methyltransferase